MFDFPHAYIQTHRSSIWLAESKKFGISIGQSQMHVIDNKIFKISPGLVDLRLKSFSSYRSFFYFDFSRLRYKQGNGHCFGSREVNHGVFWFGKRRINRSKFVTVILKFHCTFELRASILMQWNCYIFYFRIYFSEVKQWEHAEEASSDKSLDFCRIISSPCSPNEAWFAKLAVVCRWSRVKDRILR